MYARVEVCKDMHQGGGVQDGKMRVTGFLNFPTHIHLCSSLTSAF